MTPIVLVKLLCLVRIGSAVMNIHLNELPPTTGNKEWVGVDIEIWALNQKTMHRPTSGRLAALQICPNDDDVYVITDEKQVPEALKRIGDSIWCLHNSKFDLTHLRRWGEVLPRKKMWDTMLVERIMYNGYYPKYAYSLADLSRRHLDIYADKSLQDSFSEDTGEMTQEQIEYSAKDPWLTRKIAIAQKETIEPNDFKIWRDIEAPVVWAVMDFKGFPIDVEGWKQVAEENQLKKDESDKYFQDTWGINPRSPGKNGAVAQVMQKEFNIEISGNTGEVFDNLCRSHAHNKLLVDFCIRILENKQYSSWVSDYGENFIDGYIEQDPQLGDVIHANVWTIGADTGRFSVSDPPIHGVASRTTLYGEEPPFRKLFRAPPGYCIIRADFPSQEARLLAYISGDEKLQELFWRGDDPYIELGKMRYQETIEKNDPRRDEAKAQFLGAGYGLTAKGIVKKYGLSYKEAKAALDYMFTTFPKLGQFVADTYTKKPELVKTIIGRKFYLNWYAEWHASNNMKNSPNQGSGADILKIAMVKLHKRLMPYPVIMTHHDELIAIAPKKYAQDVANVIGEEMEKAGTEMTKGKLPFPMRPTLVQNWSEDK